MSDYTPITEEVKANYALVGDDEVVNNINEQKFDRWLGQHDAEVAKATEERIIKLLEENAHTEELLSVGFYEPEPIIYLSTAIALIKNFGE